MRSEQPDHLAEPNMKNGGKPLRRLALRALKMGSSTENSTVYHAHAHKGLLFTNCIGAGGFITIPLRF